MRKIAFLLLFLAFSCDSERKDFADFTLVISEFHYILNLSTGEFKIHGIEPSDTIHLSAKERNEIAERFFDLQIDTIAGEKFVLRDSQIMPDPWITISISGKQISELRIHDNLQETKLNQFEKGVNKFKNDLFKILKKNKDYIRCMDTLKNNYDKLPKLM